MHRRELLVMVLLSVSAVLAARQDRPVPPQRLASGVAAIMVDAVVRDGKGHPVTDLRKEDFQLVEDGVQQEIGDVTLVKPGRAESGSAPVAAGAVPAVDAAVSRAGAPAGPSFLAIVFDRLSPESRALAYKGALACLDTLQPTDHVGVFLSDLTLTTIQPYTNDKERLRAAIKDVAGRATSVFNRAAIKVIGRSESLGDAHASVPVVASAESAGRPVDTRDPSAGRGAPVDMSPDRLWEIMARDQQGYATTNALLAITTALGVLPGRKTVLFFAEGLAIPGAVLPHFKNVVVTANRGNVSVYTIDAAGLRVHSTDAETGREVRAMGAAQLQLNADGSSGGSLGMLERNEDVLRKDPRTSLSLLAGQTGGFLVENTNDLGTAFRRIDADRRFHYLLTYTPRNSELDGTWRSITVKVPARRVEIRARSGYLAVRGSANLPLLAYEGPALAALERSPAPADLPVRASALVFPGGALRPLVVLAATDAGALRFDRDDKTLTYRSDFTILARIVDGNGQVVRKASQPYRLTGAAAQMEQAQRGQVLFFRQPVLGPGSYTLEVAVHDALAARSGVRRSTFIVPAVNPPSLQVSSLVLVQRMEHIRPEERQPDNPLYAGDVLMYPNLGEPIRKTGQKTIAFYVVIVPSSGAPLQSTLEVLRDGQTVEQNPVTLAAADATGRITHVGQLAIDTFPMGSYTLRLTVLSGGGRETRDVKFELID